MADMSNRTVTLNGLGDKIHVINADVCDAPTILGRGTIQHIVCNPPYGQPGTTLHNPRQDRDIARHQPENGLSAWWKAAFELLSGKGRISIVYPAPRMLELMDELQRVRLTPKRFRLVYPSADKPANLVLLEAMKDGKPMLHTEPPLIVYEPDGSMTPELKRIYHMDGEIV